MFAFYAAVPVVAADVSGVTIAHTAVVGGHPLQLNGAGTSYKLIFKIYVGSLYLPQAVTDLPGVLAQPTRRIQMNLLRDVTAEQLVGALLGGIRDNNSPTDVAAVKESTDELVRILRSVMPAKVKNRDIITMDFIDGGTIVALNGQAGGVIAGEAFNRALTRIWLGDKPAHGGLKMAMLGG